MKKNIFIYAVIFACETFCFCDASCQTTLAIRRVSAGEAGKLMPGYNSGMPVTHGTEYRNNFSIRAVRQFIKRFSYAKEVTWRKANDGGIVAQFFLDSIQTTVGYTNAGSWNYILKRYAENKMPPDIKALVKGSYFDYNIGTTTEITLPQETDFTFYSTVIKKGDNFKILRICNGEMEVTGDYTKP